MDATKKNPHADTPAVRMLVVAMSGAGKSYYVSDYVVQQMRRGLWSPKRTLIFSKTFRHDPSQRKLIAYCTERWKHFEQRHCFEDADVVML